MAITYSTGEGFGTEGLLSCQATGERGMVRSSIRERVNVQEWTGNSLLRDAELATMAQADGTRDVSSPSAGGSPDGLVQLPLQQMAARLKSGAVGRGRSTGLAVPRVRRAPRSGRRRSRSAGAAGAGGGEPSSVAGAGPESGGGSWLWGPGSSAPALRSEDHQGSERRVQPDDQQQASQRHLSASAVRHHPVRLGKTIRKPSPPGRGPL